MQGPWVGSGTWESPRLVQGLSPASPLLTHSCLTSPGPRFITATSRPELSSLGTMSEVLGDSGLLCKFLLSTLDLTATINTNYASLSVKLRRTRLRGSSSIQSWRTNRTAIFNPGNVSREPAAWHRMCLSLLLQMEFFTFQRNIFCFQLKVYEGGKSLRDVNTQNIFPFRKTFL